MLRPVLGRRAPLERPRVAVGRLDDRLLIAHGVAGGRRGAGDAVQPGRGEVTAGARLVRPRGPAVRALRDVGGAGGVLVGADDIAGARAGTGDGAQLRLVEGDPVLEAVAVRVD